MKLSVKVFMVALALANGVLAFATPDPQLSRAVTKAKEAVMDAKPYDWETLAESAQVCFEKNENIEEALIWIEKSIEINENPMNLEVKGDYYASINHKKTALECYFKAIEKGKEENFWFNTDQLQAKIWKLR